MDATVAYNTPYICVRNVHTFNGYTKKEVLHLAKKKGLENKMNTLFVVWANGVCQRFERHGTRWYEVLNWTVY